MPLPRQIERLFERAREGRHSRGGNTLGNLQQMSFLVIGEDRHVFPLLGDLNEHRWFRGRVVWHDAILDGLREQTGYGTHNIMNRFRLEPIAITFNGQSRTFARSMSLSGSGPNAGIKWAFSMPS